MTRTYKKLLDGIYIYKKWFFSPVCSLMNARCVYEVSLYGYPIIRPLLALIYFYTVDDIIVLESRRDLKFGVIWQFFICKRDRTAEGRGQELGFAYISLNRSSPASLGGPLSLRFGDFFRASAPSNSSSRNTFFFFSFRSCTELFRDSPLQAGTECKCAFRNQTTLMQQSYCMTERACSVTSCMLEWDITLMPVCSCAGCVIFWDVAFSPFCLQALPCTM